ncbi:sulfate reduction electron transfer complex DsrMKJOP subunit DsrJ [Desulfogranum japonicum]|uniref:sulfate reduction electron transfer complex DsrMKJOP subunit DsrJ n=1 Tax=Desulfogranum japonicum TaxID=231447 RepID=UPI00040D3759|nr:sulfate reduction electron transfer complex DsrMKJOP subunit DsrJ [Desulfogranum japonicum]
MYDSSKIIPGLIIFVLFVTIPIWYNHGDAGAAPEIKLPQDAKACVRPTAEMRASHMQLLNQWRDEVLRDGDRGTIEVDGKHYKKSLMLTCMECHTSKKQFCDKCHDYASVKPYCWDCHLAPVE